MKYSVITFGCRVNQADSLGFEEELLAGGAVAVVARGRRSRRRQHLLGDRDRRSGRAPDDPPHRPRQSRRADRRHRLLRDAAARRSRGAAERRRASSPNDDKPRLDSDPAARVRGLDDRGALRRRRRQLRRGDRARRRRAGRRSRCACRPAAPSRARYCIIPTTRGAPRSVPIDDVLREVERVAAAGFKEIALTGVHLGSYGRDLDAALVAGRSAACARRLCAQRLRPSASCSASARSSRWTARARSSISSPRRDRFAPHFHLPLQHASDRVLAAMRRPYTIDVLRGARRRHPRADPARLDRLGHHRRLSRARPTTTSSSSRRISSARR